MSQALLLTQCLQNDFVKPIGPHERLPNLLHIGYEESRRLMGENPAEGPVARVMQWAYAQSDEALALIHIRDWHQLSDMQQMDHLMHFGPHCEAESEGAAFAFPVPEQSTKDIGIVNTPTLNDFHGTNLVELLAPHQGQKRQVGLMGVWTEAKITYLAYELSTRYPEFEIGICSALTAGASRSQHFLALEQLEKLLGVRVFHSIAAFISFLGGNTEALPLTGWKASSKPILVLNSLPTLSETDGQLVRYLFRDARVVRLQRLHGGYSGNEVLGTRSSDLQGHQQVSHVVKIGWHHLIGQERVAFEAIESVMGNNAPRIVDFAEVGERAALKYRYASMSNTFSQTFQSLYTASDEQGQPTWPLEAVQKTLYTVFVEQLGRLYAAARYEKLDLLAYYEYSSQLAGDIRRSVEKILGQAADSETLHFEDGTHFPNLCHFYEQSLPRLQSRQAGSGCYLSYVHGDLNGANILRDEHQNVWLIDFYHTHRGHVLRDLIKLENDLLYLMTPIENEAALSEALEFSRFLLKVEDLRTPLPELEKLPLVNPHLRRVYQVIRTLRSFYPELIHSDRNPLQLLIGQLRYAAHTLNFSEASPLQKKWALYTAALCAQEVEWRILEQKGDLWVAWLPRLRTAPGRLGLTILPGRQDRRRVLAKDLQTLKENQITHIATLVTENELEDYGVADLLEACEDQGFASYHLPIVDQGTASLPELKQLLSWIQAALDQGGQVLVHCVGGLGRSGMVAACYLRQQGLPFHQALAEVRGVRSPRAVESPEQEAMVRDFI